MTDFTTVGKEITSFLKIAALFKPELNAYIPLIAEAAPVLDKLVPLLMALAPVIEEAAPVIHQAMALVNHHKSTGMSHAAAVEAAASDIKKTREVADGDAAIRIQEQGGPG